MCSRSRRGPARSKNSSKIAQLCFSIVDISISLVTVMGGKMGQVPWTLFCTVPSPPATKISADSTKWPIRDQWWWMTITPKFSAPHPPNNPIQTPHYPTYLASNKISNKSNSRRLGTWASCYPKAWCAPKKTWVARATNNSWDSILASSASLTRTPAR